MPENVFVRALRRKIRFTGIRGGQLTVEDLFDLNRNELDRLYRQIPKETTDGLEVTKATREQSLATLCRDVLREVHRIRTEAEAAAERRAERTARNSRVLELIAEKQDGALKEKSIDELKSLLASGDNDTLEDG